MTARLGQAFPRGWKDFGLQLCIWFGFLLAYQVVRGLADHDAVQAFVNGRSLIGFESKLHALVEVDIQNVVLRAGDWFVQILNWTYWNSQFTVVGIALLWVYFRRNEAFTRLRNLLIVANLLALVGFVAMPTAPPRMFPEWGFVDTLATSAALNHGSGLVQLASNQFAAMPSIHSADALILGFVMAALVRSTWAKVLWTLWPSWVWFTVMATGNHYWVDIAGGVLIALIAASLVVWGETWRSRDSLARVTVRG
jgi:membrane-associated phospholipid phosphatase